MTAHANGYPKVGIDDLSVYIPGLYLPIEALAEARDLDYAKLHHGLGLTSMAVPDAGEDAATFAANAVRDLIERNQLDPRHIGRIYLGTESALDGAKPTATYTLDMLSHYFAPRYGADCFLNCDVVDLTFACIGAVDALQNTVDWVRGGAGRIGIVVASDVARYELGSGGEYTQGAGAVAALVRHQPRLLALGDAWGVATRPAHDFFKPTLKVGKEQLVAEVLRLAGLDDRDAAGVLARLPDTLDVSGVLDGNDELLTLHRETPVFDGPYSNDCYQERIGEALAHFVARAGLPADEPATDRWARLVFHLPYAFQARRMFPEIFMEEARRRGDWPQIEAALGSAPPRREEHADERAYAKARAEYLRTLSRSAFYRAFVRERIEPGEQASSLVGNLYTASIFLALMSTLETALSDGDDLRGRRLGFFAYGSGSKSKVFEGEVQPQWREVAGRFGLRQLLAQRRPIDYPTYERLHRGRQTEPAGCLENRFRLAAVETEKENYVGARTYAVPVAVAVPVG